jgi:hypothetical protein
LDVLCHKPAVLSKAALYEGLGLIGKRIRQRVAANVTNRERLPFSFQHKIHSAGKVMNTPGCDGTARAHALALR